MFDWTLSVPSLLAIIALFLSAIKGYNSIWAKLGEVQSNVKEEVRVLRHDLRTLEQRQAILEESMTLVRAKHELEVKALDTRVNELGFFIRDRFVTKEDFKDAMESLGRSMRDGFKDIGERIDELKKRNG